MAAGVIAATTPYCRACGWDFVAINTGDDSICDSCGDTLAESLAGALDAPTDLAAATGTDEVIFSWTASAVTDDVQYTINGVPSPLDDDAASPYSVPVDAVGEVCFQVRAVDANGTPGPWSPTVCGKSGQAPPTLLTAVAASLAVDFTFTADPAADSTDLFYTIDAAGDTTVTGVVSGVSVAALEGEVVEGQVRSVQDGVAGVYSAADSETALA